MATKKKQEAEEMEPPGASTISQGTLTSRAYRELLRRILNLELAPGTSFSESEIAGELGLSKTPVREALVMLILFRFVSVQRRSGYVVAPITLREARDLFAVKSALEPEVAALAAEQSVSSGRLEQMRELALAARTPGDVDAMLNANARFHIAIAGATHNHHLLRAMEAPTYHTQRLYRLIVELTGRPEDAAQRHDELLDAVAAGRTNEARELAREGLQRAHKWTFEALMSADILQQTNLAVAGGDSDVS